MAYRFRQSTGQCGFERRSRLVRRICGSCGALLPPANKPALSERDACAPYLRRELSLLTNVHVVIALGGFAHQIASSELGIRPRPPFGHGTEVKAPNGTVLLSSYHPSHLLSSYHPSQRDAFTGTLTESMLDDVLIRARYLTDCDPPMTSTAQTKRLIPKFWCTRHCRRGGSGTFTMNFTVNEVHPWPRWRMSIYMVSDQNS